MTRYFGVLLLTCVVGCGATSRQAPATANQAETRPDIVVPRTVVTATDAHSITELLRQAAALGAAERWGEAATAYDRVYRLEPEGSAGEDALWGAADAHDRAGNLDTALARYELFAERAADSPKGRQALVRATRLLVFDGRYAEAGVHAELLLKHIDELSDFERIAVYSARALALVASGEDKQAQYFVEKGRDIIDQRQFDAAGRVPRDLAQLYYALGETRRVQAERVLFDPTPPNFGAVLEQRCQLLLDAQSAYSDTMRAYDAHWSAMAGFRVVELYENLHRDLMAVKPPASADTERKRQLFEGAVRTRYSILLTKAKGMAEHTLSMAERTHEQSQWVQRTREALRSIDQGIHDEETALSKLPYTKADFDAYFAEQEAKAQTAGQPPGPTTGPAATGHAPKRR